MKKTVRRLFCGAVASAMLLNSGFSVGAAGLRDIFDADYYAEKYSDLKEAYGNDEEALYQHFINYGIKEGRVMNPVIDVVKYREQYKDLQEAFGDDWDAYINHYFVYGVNEHRENGTDFDLLAYLNAYGDLKEAYGDDYVALAKHYEELGIHENRVEASKVFIKMEQEEKQNSAKNASVKESGTESGKQESGNAGGETTGGNEQGDVKQEYDVREINRYGSWRVKHYDANDRLIYNLYYNANGEFESGTAYFYNEAGQLVQMGGCNSDGSFRYADEKYEYDSAGNMIRRWYFAGLDSNGNMAYNNFDYTYDSNGNMLTSKMYYYDGRVGDEMRYTYDSNGNLLTETLYNPDGSSRLCAEYTYNNNILTEKWEYNISWGIVHNVHEIYNEHGKVVERYQYDANGEMEIPPYSYTYEYAENGNEITTMYIDGKIAAIFKTTYTSEGKIAETVDSYGNRTNLVKYKNDGTIETTDYRWVSSGEKRILHESITFYATGDGPVRNVWESYNEKGDITSHTTRYGEEIVNDYDASYTATYEYAEDGSKVETRYDLEKNVRDVIKYNSAGEVIE